VIRRLWLAALAALVVVPVALAGPKSSSVAAYWGKGSKVPHQVASAAPAQGGQTLPFTGVDLAYALLFAALVIGLGIALRRYSRPSA